MRKITIALLTIFISLMACEKQKINKNNHENDLFYAANSFTPDGSFFNNTWKIQPKTGVNISDFHLIISNRYNAIIFESYDVSTAWDGSFNNNRVQDDVYTWYVDIKEAGTAESKVFTGFVSVLK